MRVNKYQPHVLVLPEDDADRQLANGFLLEPNLLSHKIQVLEEAGGWSEVLSAFRSVHVKEMDAYASRFMVLLIDFDRDEDRLNKARDVIPERLAGRVFVLGAWTNPEKLRSTFGCPLEAIGMALAKDCREDTDTTWGHELLKHNAAEITRLRDRVRPFLFHP